MKLNRTALSDLGFDGFLPLRKILLAPFEVPDKFGIYAVIRTNQGTPAFLPESRAARFRNRDLSYPVGRLLDKWIPMAQVIYIGKAGPTVGRHLRRRINEFVRFGDGTAIGHRGGRAIWQLPDVWECLLAWKACSGIPRESEKQLIAEFKQAHGKIPFANFTE